MAVRRLAIGVAAFSALLCVLSIVVERVEIPFSEVRQYFDMFSTTANLPAWWSTVLLLSGALAHGLAGFAARTGRVRARGAWFVGTAVLALLALTEHTNLHDRIVGDTAQIVGDTTRSPDWVVVNGVAALAVVVTFVLVGVRIGGRAGALLVVGALVLLGSAVGGRVVVSVLLAERGGGRLVLLTAHAAELGENIGAILLLVAAMSVLRVTREGVTREGVTRDGAVLRLHYRGPDRNRTHPAPALVLRWRRGWHALLAVSVALSALSLTVVLLLAPMLGPEFLPWRHYFDVLIEDNLPTWFSAGLLFITALAHALVGVVARMARVPAASGWFVTAGLLGLLALDDHTQLHERSEKLGRQIATFESHPFHWLIPGAIAGSVVAAVIVWLAFTNQGRTRWLLITGITVLFTSALGLEIVQGFYMAAGNENLGFVLTYHAEELGENIGALLLLAAALGTLSCTREDGGVGVRYRPPQPGLDAPEGPPTPGISAANGGQPAAEEPVPAMPQRDGTLRPTAIQSIWIGRVLVCR